MTNLFLDFDGTIINSIQAFCQVYTELYKDDKDYLPPEWWLVETWNMTGQCPLITDVNDIFSSQMFFDYCDFLNGNTKEIIKLLSEKYNVIICTIGTIQNLANKSKWIKTNLPFIKDYVLLVNSGNKMDKSIVNMESGIFIDDVDSNLRSSNAGLKICMGDVYDWNKDSIYIRAINWAAIQEILL